ncbi:Tad domain-containing protein [Acidimicrobiia bacterium EGI L10123]|uniref:pilus assembly protein TadG-related protein n=1 Tax=Salinilacustrithrix flava TaxID=2957203 RepID=UPI003D7C1475|nr:Tad domain-containing protein [Acidimicrobiia bacterium EGI L10123]
MRVAHRRDERGAVLIIVAAFALVSIAFLAFVIDIGNQRQNRRQLTTATDASALDVAQEWANYELDATLAGFTSLGGDKYDCTSKAVATLQANNEGVAFPIGEVSCVAEFRTTYGVVTVGASEEVQYAIGGAVGVSSGGTGSTTSVRITGPAQGGLRPFGLCANEPSIKSWLEADDQTPKVVQSERFLPDKCGNSSGGWGLLDLLGGSNPAVAKAYSEGYGESVQLSPDPDQCIDTTPKSCFTASTGAKWNGGPIKDALDFLEGPSGCAEGGIEFSLPLYQTVVDPGGKQAKFPISGFARVQLMCYATGGSNGNTITLKLLDFDEEGPCCGGITATNRLLEVCDVGTIGGSVGPKFVSNCGAPPPVQPPDVGLVCAVTPVSPSSRDVQVDASNRPTTAVVVTVDVADSSDCDLRLRAKNATYEILATQVDKTATQYKFEFATTDAIAPPDTTLALEVYDGDGFIWDGTATLTTTEAVETPASCEVNSVVVDPLVVGTKGNSLEGDVKITVNLRAPTNCTGLNVDMVQRKSNGAVNRVASNYTPPAGTTSFVVTIPSGASTYQNNSFFDVVIERGGDELTYSPPAFLDT